MKKGTQRALHGPCGRTKILAQGLCGTCYTLKRQDEEYFGGLREAVLKRDGHRCCVCSKPGGQSEVLPFIIALPASQSWI
jgi:5-methylcytosine-specific restriction endonuclease McrA